MSSITSTFWELRSRGGLFNPRALVGLLIPKVVENMLDAKEEVDARLRGAINDFTRQFVGRMTAPIDTHNGKKVPVTEAPARTKMIRQNIEQETPFLRQKLEEYISDHRTREMLVAAVAESVTHSYEEWFDVQYTPSIAGSNGAGRSTKGKGREDGVWDPDVFGEWCKGVFKVGSLAGHEVENDEEYAGSGGEGESEVGSTRNEGLSGGGLRIKM
jgi:hypothetical protein